MMIGSGAGANVKAFDVAQGVELLVHINTRLVELVRRLGVIRESLGGPQPTSTGSEQQVYPSGLLGMFRSRTDEASETVSDAENILAGIEQGLGVDSSPAVKSNVELRR